MKSMNKKLLAVSVSAAVALMVGCNAKDGDDGAAGADGSAGATGATGATGVAGQDLTAIPKIIRLATTPLGSEVTGLFKTDNGELFFNVQHPSDTLPAPENMAAVGVVEGLDFDNLPQRIDELPVPNTIAEKQSVLVTAGGTYNALGREEDTFAGALPFGLGAIVDTYEDKELKQSGNPDFNAFIATAADGSEGYLFTAWEDRPGGMSRLKVENDDGVWSVDTSDVLDIDFSSVEGTMINCFGTLSPWGTPLTSEENYMAEVTYEWNNSALSGGYPSYADVQLIQDYNDGEFPNPYRYGYIVEVTDPTSATPVPVKHFTLGRMAHENAVVMPDLKTVYTTDDGTNKPFYKFVADTAGDLSKGRLYAAKLTQDATNDPAKAGFDIEWADLGHRNNTQLEAFIASYDGLDEGDAPAGTLSYSNTSYVTQAEIDAWAADWADNGALDTVPATHAAIPFVESLKAVQALDAAGVDVTHEFRKMEGVDINYDGAKSGAIPFMYVAMSAIGKGMSDTEGDIQLTSNDCGAVYRFGLDVNYNVSRMDPIVVGVEDPLSASNPCSVDGVSNPDNLIVLDDGRVLIGEDTGKHENNMIWLYNPKGE